MKNQGCAGAVGSSVQPSAALFHYRHHPMNYTEPVNTSIIEGKGVWMCVCVCVCVCVGVCVLVEIN